MLEPDAAGVLLVELELLQPAASRIDPTAAAAATIVFDARKVTLPSPPGGYTGRALASWLDKSVVWPMPFNGRLLTRETQASVTSRFAMRIPTCFIRIPLTGNSIISRHGARDRKCQRTAGVGPPTFADGPHGLPPPLSSASAVASGDGSAPAAAITGCPARVAVPIRVPILRATTTFPPSGRRRFASPTNALSAPPPGKPEKLEKNKCNSSIQNGCGFLWPAHRCRPVLPAAAWRRPAVPAAAGAPARGARATAARPRSSRPTRRPPGASRARTVGTAAAPRRWRRPPSPERSPRRPARAPSRERTAQDPFPGRQPVATSRAAPPQARHAGLVAELQPCADPPNHSRPRFTGDSLLRIGNTTYTAYLYEECLREPAYRMFMHVQSMTTKALTSVRLPFREPGGLQAHGCAV